MIVTATSTISQIKAELEAKDELHLQQAGEKFVLTTGDVQIVLRDLSDVTGLINEGLAILKEVQMARSTKTEETPVP